MPAPPVLPATVTRTTRASYLLSFLGDVSIGLFTFSISLYTVVLADGLGMGEAEKAFWVGLVATGWGAIYWFSPILLGKISDRIGRRASLMITMTGFSVLNLVIMLVATHPLHLFIIYCIVAFFFGFYFPVLGAYSSEISEPFGKEHHAHVLSVFMISWSIGLSFGPLIGGGVAVAGPTVSFALLISVAACIVIVAWRLVLSPTELSRVLKDGEHPSSPTAPGSGPGSGGTDQAPATVNKGDLIFIKICIVCAPLVFSFDNQILFSIFPAFGVDYMSLGVLFASFTPSLAVGLLVFGLGMGRTLTFFHAGKIQSWRLKARLMVVAPAGMAVANLCIFLFPVADVLLPVLFVYGAFSGYTFAIGLIAVMELSKTGKGSMAGIYEGLVGIGTFGSTFISSFIGQVNPAFPFLLSAAFAAIIFIIITCASIFSKRVH